MVGDTQDSRFVGNIMHGSLTDDDFCNYPLLDMGSTRLESI